MTFSPIQSQGNRILLLAGVPVVTVLLASLWWSLANARAPRDAAYWYHQFCTRKGHEQAAEALQRLGPDALPLLVEELSKGPPAPQRKSAYFHFWERAPRWLRGVMPQPALPRQQVFSDLDAVVSSILTQLILAGPAKARAVPVLKPLPEMPGFPHGLEAAAALWSVSRQQELGLPYLARQMTNTTIMQRLNALKSVSPVIRGATALVPPMIGLLEGEDHGVACYVANLLGRIGPTAREALPALRHAAESDHASLRQQAADAILRIETGHTDAPPAAEPASIVIPVGRERAVF
ncbi:MAG TPA: hypothetical protein VHH73_18470 [Verrucomicrobiae bacterium]|nr:hypothetical protein [Verrucomicrobiae bacterium]